MSRARDDRGLRLLVLITTTIGKGLARQASETAASELMDLLDRLAACLGVGLVTGDDDLVRRTTPEGCTRSTSPSASTGRRFLAKNRSCGWKSPPGCSPPLPLLCGWRSGPQFD
jgi:hypothetical protein